ncbi:MAG TPA: hypothetical protein VD770_00075 [Coxiellaceae bacterium]|nr:hypothetical protein [Coxiellaceae bacterium]
MRRIYTEYLILAQEAINSSARLSSASQKIETAILSMLRSYAAKTFWFFGDREFAADFRIILERTPFALASVIETLNSLARSRPRTAGGDFEHLLLAIYIFLKQKSQEISKLDTVETRVFYGRGPTHVQLCVSLKNSVMYNATTGVSAPQETYDFYQLHAATVPTHDMNLKIRTILTAYTRGFARTYADKISEICKHTSELNPLLEALNAWAIDPSFRGFTPNGDMENALVAIYILLPPELRVKIKNIRVTLNGTLQTLEKKFPLLLTKLSVASASITPASSVAASGVGLTVSDAYTNVTIPITTPDESRAQSLP